MHRLALQSVRRAAVGLSLCGVFACSARGQDGYLIRLSEAKPIEVVPYRLPPAGREERQTGIAVWSRGGPEQWAVLPGQVLDLGKSSELAAALRANTRGGESNTTAGPEAMTFQPEQLLGQVVTRAGGFHFLTPPEQGFCLDGKLTFRRNSDDGAVKYPAAEVSLRRANQEVLKLTFAVGQAELRWADVANLPANLKDGLTPGAYTLRIGDGPVTSFQIVPANTREQVLAPLERLKKVTAADSSVYLLALVQHLLYQQDEEGEPRSYAADGLSELDAFARAHEDRARHEKWFTVLRQRVVQQLNGGAATHPADPAATGIEIIDQARAAIQEGNWDTALQTLSEPAAEATPRARHLAILYRAVIAAESGSSAGDTPDQLFREAIARLQTGDAIDQFRAHNNYGGLLFARARDQVHNHAFQTAAGGGTPILRALEDWRGALENYEAALLHAEKLDASLAAGVKVNLAGLYGLLADLIRVLDVPVGDKRRFEAGETAATTAADELLRQVLAQSNTLDAVTRAAAHESAAQILFRARRFVPAKVAADQALESYLEAESLAGVESTQRLIGLIHAPQALSQRAVPEIIEAALRPLQTSQLLSEMLRQRIPADRAGRSRAGFFARRAYVSERIMELHLARAENTAALEIAEASKARSLQDVLAQRGVAVNGVQAGRGLQELLAKWPADTAAVEYFLGTEDAWVFVITPAGHVGAWRLTDAAGRRLASRDIVRRVQQLLAGFEGQANKMFRRASAGNGFDTAWQDDLHRFYNELLPPAVRGKLAGAKQVVIVPHHVLNYFPFAALVTERDAAPRGKLEMPQPKFLIDEAFAVLRAPSLAAWDLLRRKESAVAQVQAVGIVEFEQADSLPGVEQDLANLKAAFGERLKKVVAAEEATEKNIREALREPGMIFIGTHGRNIAEQPLAGYLLCHGGESDDGLLTAGELFSGEVGASLVVLSACYSGLADQSPLPGDDLFGLERAFLSAGAATVVSGLWDVYDGTGPLLMNAFFGELVAGKPAAAALVSAQRTFLADRRREGPGDPWIHPYFWAVYTISGSDLTALERSAR